MAPTLLNSKDGDLLNDPTRQRNLPDGGPRRSGDPTHCLSPAIREGTVLKQRYLLEKKIGEGGIGLVFRARDLEEERISRAFVGKEANSFLAIKVIRPEHVAFRASILAELVKTRDLSSEYIVRAGDCQEDGDLLFMTMEYLEGKTLRSLLDEDFARGVPWDLAERLILGMGTGLARAHDRGLVHCDFKPANVFVVQPFVPKILDFGIARARRDRNTSRDAGEPVGLTRFYASPEMIRAWDQGETDGYEPDYRDDIFALACVVYEVLTARHPFSGTGNDAEIARQRNFRCPPIPRLSKRQNEALWQALAYDREQRTARVETLLSELLPLAEDRVQPIHTPTKRKSLVIGWIAGGVVIVGAGIAITLRLVGGSNRPEEGAAATASPAGPVSDCPNAGASSKESMNSALDVGIRAQVNLTLFPPGSEPHRRADESLRKMVNCLKQLQNQGVSSADSQKFLDQVAIGRMSE